MNFYLYKFIDENENILYVGQTNSIKRRISHQHFSKNGHLPVECYEETHAVLYMECSSQSDLNIREEYLINSLSPPFNNRMNRKQKFSFRINDWNWEYLPSPRKEEFIAGFKDCNYPAQYIIRNDFHSQEKILHYEVIPTVSTKILERHGPDIYAVSISKKIWVFFEHFIDSLMAENGFDFDDWPLTINNMTPFIEKGYIGFDDICITTDKHLIHLNIWEDVDEGWLRGDHTVLVTLQGCINFLENLSEEDFCNGQIEREEFAPILKTFQYHLDNYSVLKNQKTDY